jgi:hypothetical protein
MIVSGALNAGLAIVWVLSLGWMCVGLLWIVPFAVAIGEALVGLLIVLGVPLRFGPAAAAIGVLNGALLFDAPAVMVQVLAMVFLNQDEARRFVALPSPAGPSSPTGQ